MSAFNNTQYVPLEIRDQFRSSIRTLHVQHLSQHVCHQFLLYQIQRNFSFAWNVFKKWGEMWEFFAGYA